MILLLNLPWYHTKTHYGVKAGTRWPHIRYRRVPYYPFPFSLAYAATVLKNAHYPYVFKDAITDNLSIEETEQYCLNLQDLLDRNNNLPVRLF